VPPGSKCISIELRLFTFNLGDAKTFWMELEDDGKVEFIFEKVQNVLQSLKQKIKMCLAQITSLSKPSFQ
jgi:hypothetical protein